MQCNHYIVSYDISEQKRWRQVYNIMRGYGEWLQLSVFQCRLTDKQHAELITLLDAVIHHKNDHILLINLGSDEKIVPRITSLGKNYEPIKHKPVIV